MKKFIVFSAVLSGFFLSPFGFAESIVFKSGKTMEAQIIEKGDEYIKVDFLGLPITYYFENIESIDGKDPMSFFGLEKAAPKPLDPKVWQQWYEGVSSYIEKIKALDAEARNIDRQCLKDLTQAMDKKDVSPADKEKIVSQAGRELSAVIQQSESLEYPAQLLDFHKRMIDVQKYLKKHIEALLVKDGAYILDCTLSAAGSNMQAIKALRETYIKYGAPEEFLKPLDSKLESYKKIFEKYSLPALED